MAKTRKKQNSEKKPPPRRGVRSFWSGAISFGLVNVPVNLFPANRRMRVSFRLLDQDGTRLQRRYYCPQDEADVHPEHILRGYPIEDDQYVIVRDEELEAIEPRKTREIDLRRFVLLSQISPMLFHRAYFLTPSGDSNKAYRLLAQVMQDSGRAGIATFVMRDREYAIAILAENGILRAQTLRFEDEVRSPDAVGLPPREAPGRSDVSRLERAIQQHTAEQLDLERMKDEYSERVRQLAEKKRKGGEGVVRAEQRQAAEEAVDEEEDADEASGVDLLETIRHSLQQRNGAGRKDAGRNGAGRKKAGRKESGGDGGGRKRSDDDLASKSKDQLYERAQELDIQGRSKLNKQQLIREIQRVRPRR